MKWTDEANEAVARVPFFVRGRVRKKVEQEASRIGAREVTIEHVQACRKQYLERMEDDVQGYRIETCFGTGGCPNQAVAAGDLLERLEECLKKRNLKRFLKKKVNGPLKFHHEFRVVVSDCPNACSRPQIADIGVIGAQVPEINPDAACSECGASEAVCRERTVTVECGSPRLDLTGCVSCGQCISACPTGTLQAGSLGYRILVGGKLGRHPRLARELPGIYSEEEVPAIVECCLDYYQQHCVEGERLGEILERSGDEDIRACLPQKDQLRTVS